MPDHSDAELKRVPEDDAAFEAMLGDVRRGLSLKQKELDPKYFYDERGSELFELITELPEYYPTRAERALLISTMPSLIDELRPASLIELGAGSASKTRVILDAMSLTGSGKQYVPVDVSSAFLRETSAKLRTEYPDMRIDPAVGDFSSELVLPPLQRPALFAFLGSTIGNFRANAAVDILHRIASSMRGDDAFILGVDLRKNPDVIEAAYNDNAGVTAEFNLNVLRVLNRELSSDFDLSAFRHRAFYDRERHRIEMHLDSTADQTVLIPGIGNVEIRKGESIRTELSYKYDRATVTSLFEKAGLCLERWLTGEDDVFGLAVGSRRWAPR
ncbi:MAG TPA: L-histidine N(alpha)-methyltransferase [Gemmatimonadaceae bacterium]|nr:L-histidine N(alpha)-methyltransferase [Gemmatimonadaceae bacterium]